MDILGWNPGHDGAIALLSDGNLEFSLEAEKSGLVRHSSLDSYTILRALARCSRAPDALSISGWEPHTVGFSTGYAGTEIDSSVQPELSVFGKSVRHFSSSHERSHIFCSFGLSPLPKGTPFYALVWEGTFGAFYEVDASLRIRKFPSVIVNPGERYVLPFALAAKFITQYSVNFDPGVLAGKAMAIAAYSDAVDESPEERELLDRCFHISMRDHSAISCLTRYSIFGAGVESQACKRLCRLMSNRIYNSFFTFAERNFTERRPLIIGGGCGLNCEWNTRLKESGLFEDVFVPPCTNDSGVALGAAIDAQYTLTGDPKVTWSSYPGDTFILDTAPSESDYVMLEYSPTLVADLLLLGNVLAWVDGRAEMGPRALGHRSLLASPLLEDSRTRLNQIKEREGYRPVAPVCIEEDLGVIFSSAQPSPHMLYFQKVLTQHLPAITHVDGTARVQSVNNIQNPKLYELLTHFKQSSGYGVLCNTSLNFPGWGFISRMSDLVRYLSTRDIQGMVVENCVYLKRAVADGLRG